MLFTSTADTLSSAYSDRWDGAGASGESEYLLINLLATNDLIFVVLFVSLIIWFVLAFYLVRVDKKIDALESKYSADEKPDKAASAYQEEDAEVVKP